MPEDNIPAVATSMLVLAPLLAITHTMSNLIAIRALDLHAIIVLRALLFATARDMSHFYDGLATL